MGACFHAWKNLASNYYSNIHDELAFSCFLVAATKYALPNVKPLDAVVPMPPSDKVRQQYTFRDAVIRSLGTTSVDEAKKQTLFVVPPIIMPEITRHGLSPVDLFPCLSKEYLNMIGVSSDASRGTVFEDVFVHALYARYLLVWWTLQSSDGWVPLSAVLANAVARGSALEIVDRLEVNLSGGVKVLAKQEAKGGAACAVENAVTWCKELPNAHHDAYMWCRKKGDMCLDGKAAALNLRHGTEKVKGELSTQVKFSRHRKEKLAMPVFVVNQSQRTTGLPNKDKFVAVDASQMTQTSWIWTMTPPTEERNSTPKEKKVKTNKLNR